MVTPRGGIWIENSVNITMENNFATCPHCGGMAKFIEGTFNFRDGIIEATIASDWTRHQLKKYQDALKWAIDNVDRRPRSVVRKIEKVNPRAGSLVRRALKNWSKADVIALLTCLLSAAMVMRGCTSDQEIDPVELHQIIEREVSERVDDQLERFEPLPPLPPDIESTTPPAPTAGVLPPPGTGSPE